MEEQKEDYSNIWQYYKEAKELYANNKYGSAITAIDNAIKIAPDEISFLFLRSFCFLEKENYLCAIEDYNKIIYFEGWNASAYNKRGIANALLGKYDAAINDFNYAEKYLRDFLKEYSLWETEWYGYFEDFMYIDKAERFPYFNRGVVSLKSGKFKEAVTEFQTVVNITPKNERAVKMLELAKKETK